MRTYVLQYRPFHLFNMLHNFVHNSYRDKAKILFAMFIEAIL